MVTSTPTLPSEVPDPITTAMKELDNTVHDKAATPEEGKVPDPITTAMKELDNTVHDKAATPEEGIDPTFAVHV